MPRIGFTGTQNGMTIAQAAKVDYILLALGQVFHHGDCIGADAMAHALARSCGLMTVCHPPKDSSKRAFTANDITREPKDYLVRNHDIVDETDILVAAPKGFEEELRSGTWATVRYARKVGRTIYIVYPDGSVKNG